jgi:hypothetical protein
MKPKWDDLQLCNIDFHYHAGRERPAPYSLDDVVTYARATGRRVLGITDHWGCYVSPHTEIEYRHYPGDFSGFLQFAADVKDAREKYTDMVIPFGPETPLPDIVGGTCDDAFKVPEVDYFLGEPRGVDVVETVGDTLIEGLEHMARLRDRVGRPCFLAHPLRGLVNYYIGGTGPGPRHPRRPPHDPLEQYRNQLAHVEEVLGICLRDFARASMDYDIPLEINESSWGRILGQNQEWFAERYLFFFRTMLDMGVKVILGSDQHIADNGACTPFTVAKILGVTPSDMTFLRHWL